MLVLGIQGSPRKKGNTSYLLSSFMKAAEEMGAETITISPYDYKISPCLEYTACEKSGTCPIKDDVESLIYPLMRRATIIVTGSPAFFYSAPSQLKALIDRTQPLWSRKYRLNLEDPLRPYRKGFFLGLGATKGKRLFEGMDLMMRYFYDAVGAAYEGMLGYREIEKPGDMAKHPTAVADVKGEAERLIRQYMSRKRLVFICRDNSFSSPAAAAFAMKLAGCAYDAEAFGLSPASSFNPCLAPLMAERGIDMGFMNTSGIESYHGDLASAIKIFIGNSESEAGDFSYDSFWKIPDHENQEANLDAILDRIFDYVENLTR